MSAESRSLDITRIDKSAFSIFVGLRAGAFVAAPLLFGIVTGQKELVYATLGALFLTNTTVPRTESAPTKILFIACFTEAIAFGLGTLSGTTGLAAIPLIGLGVFSAMSLGKYPGWAPVGMFTAIFFAVGVGLPGGSVSDASTRLIFSLIGALWGLLGVEIRRFIGSHRTTPTKGVDSSSGRLNGINSNVHNLKEPLLRSNAIKHAIVVGVASAIGLAVGLALGLPRDFWIVVTIILALRPTIPATFSFTAMIVIGTLIGAIIAASVTFEITNDYLLWVLLLVFSIALYATRGMNLGITQAFFTPFVIILLNILYLGHWQLAEVRILDVTIGGGIALLTAFILMRRRLAIPTKAKSK